MHIRAAWLLAALAGCGGGQGGPGPGQNPTDDASRMSGWIHRDDGKFAYFVPTDKWPGVESISGIDISFPIGDADVGYAFAYGPLVPNTIEGVEAAVWPLLSNIAIVSQSAIGPGALGTTRTTEFTAVWKATGRNIHGILKADLGNQIIDSYLMIAYTTVWPDMALTLRLIRDHITYFGVNPNR